ncbi:MAG: prepilin peptidase [bacterium]|nr:prepilin peptidase [bacterium]
MVLTHEPALFYALAALLGACFGSFSNVLIHRLPRNLSIVRPRSACPACARPVEWHENIPVLSWLALRGRCRGCAAPIALRYLLVELGGVACALVGVWSFGFGFAGLSASLLLLLLLDIALIDWEHMIIPHTLTIAGAVIGLGGSFLDGRDPASAFLGAAVGAGGVLAVSWGYRLVRGVVGMGGGDVMLMGMVGSFLGPWGVLGTLFGGALAGTAYALLAGRGRVVGGAKLPFGTFLAAAAAVVLLFGPRLAAWYLGLAA